MRDSSPHRASECCPGHDRPGRRCSDAFSKDADARGHRLARVDRHGAAFDACASRSARTGPVSSDGRMARASGQVTAPQLAPGLQLSRRRSPLTRQPRSLLSIPGALRVRFTAPSAFPARAARFAEPGVDRAGTARLRTRSVRVLDGRLLRTRRRPSRPTTTRQQAAQASETREFRNPCPSFRLLRLLIPTAVI